MGSSGGSPGPSILGIQQVMASGDYITSPFFVSATATRAATLNDVVFIPVLLGAAITADRISMVVDTLGASSVVRLGIYTPHPTTKKPGSLVLDAGTVLGSTTGVKEITISQALAAGWYWLAAVAQTAACSWKAASNSQAFATAIGANNLVFQTPTQNYYKQAGVAGALPATATPAFAGNVNLADIPIIALRAA